MREAPESRQWCAGGSTLRLGIGYINSASWGTAVTTALP